jgi:hypothetical protein
MSTETRDAIRAVRSLSDTALYGQAIARLSVAAGIDPASGARQHLAEGLPVLRKLSPGLRRLAWLESFGRPRERRMQPAGAMLELWERGINRSAEVWSHTRGLARLAAAWSNASHHEGSTLMRDLAATHAFEVLAGDATEEELAWEGVWLMLMIGPGGCANIKMCAEFASLESLQQVSAEAEWLHALATPDAPDVAPPTSTLTRIAVTLAPLRGLRRRGARANGRRIGRYVHQSLQTLTRGSTRNLDVRLPACLVGDESLRPKFAPLVQDLLTCAIAENAPHADLRQGARTICECCPTLLMQSIETHRFAGSHAPDDSSTPLDWLESLLGLTSLDESLNMSNACRG